MPRILIPSSFEPIPTTTTSLHLCNPAGHSFVVHAVSNELVRVVHALPEFKYGQKVNGGVKLEKSEAAARLQIDEQSRKATIELPSFRVKLDHSKCPRLQFFRQGEVEPFQSDSVTRAYSFDAQTGAVMHFTDRENYLPISENEDRISPDPTSPSRNEFIYGLGESRGFEKSGRKFTFEGRDALGYSAEHGDPLYKSHPFYCVYNKRAKKWHGVFYNSLVDSSIDMGAEGDILFGCFRTYKANSGPLDYYILCPTDGTLPSLITLYASLVSPSHSTPFPLQASPMLPPLSQFGYLASSLSLAADPRAQEAVIEFVKTCRSEGFPLDGLYLSSGWCQEEETDLRHYFSWNLTRYPSPSSFGQTIEHDLGVQLIVNVKPWLLETHPFLTSASSVGAFVRASKDALGDSERASEEGDKKDWVWSSGFGAHALGRYFDYSSKAGTKWWIEAIRKYLLDVSLTGVWIDNNEMAGMVDDEAVFRGENGIWNAELVGGGRVGRNVEERMGWGRGETTVGRVGKATQTMGMARATYEALLLSRPNHRPVIVSRSGVPGIQAYAHASWSGDNATTWASLASGVALTLSLGLSFGPGLYGHDIGGFAGAHHPSAELLVRWCQNGMYHSRFTVHSWKATSTTLWMYNNVPGVTEILRDVLAWRYRLVPTAYSLYVTHYQRRGWPIVKPLLWYHSTDPLTLLESQTFLFGSHVLVASVLEFGAWSKKVYLPSVTNNEEERKVEWCELDTGIWHEGGQEIVMDAPLSRTPTLIRAGGMLVLGPKCTKNLSESIASRHVLIFPSLTDLACKGGFTLIEDDGVSNDHTREGKFTELELWYRVKSRDEVEVGVEVNRNEYETRWKEVSWELPRGDRRKVVLAKGMDGRYDDDGGCISRCFELE